MGEHLRTLRVPGGGISSLSWEGDGLRLALAVSCGAHTHTHTHSHTRARERGFAHPQHRIASTLAWRNCRVSKDVRVRVCACVCVLCCLIRLTLTCTLPMCVLTTSGASSVTHSCTRSLGQIGWSIVSCSGTRSEWGTERLACSGTSARAHKHTPTHRHTHKQDIGPSKSPIAGTMNI